jgi:hypothetical protein
MISDIGTVIGTRHHRGTAVTLSQLTMYANVVLRSIEEYIQVSAKQPHPLNGRRVGLRDTPLMCVHTAGLPASQEDVAPILSSSYFSLPPQS